MSKQNELPLFWVLKPSDRLKQAIMLLHLLACGASLNNTLAVPIKIGLCVVIYTHLRYITKLLSRADYMIRYSEQLGWEIARHDEYESVQILKSTVLTVFAIILDVKLQNKERMTLLIVNDALSTAGFRQLIVKLRIQPRINSRKYGGSG
jgi:hypothetical protein